MDDYSIASLTESKNEWCARLVTLLTQHVITGIDSIFSEAVKLCEENPILVEHYGIDSNKGYGAKKHMEGITKYGISPWHRKTFGICKEILKGNSDNIDNTDNTNNSFHLNFPFLKSMCLTSQAP